MPFSLLNTNEYNSKLLSLLTHNLPDMLWVKDLNGIYIYANESICSGLLMAKDTQEPIGKDDVFFALRERELHKENRDWHTFGELCFNSDKEVIKNEKAMKFEEYGNVKGEMLYLEVYKAPFYDDNGQIAGTVGTGRDITELKKTQQNLEDSIKEIKRQKELFKHQAAHDILTDLPNRTQLLNALENSILNATQNNSKFALLFIDLDHFKGINDSFGHNIGDLILVEISVRMKSKMRDIDTLSRLGGDEFCIILENINDIDEVTKIITDGMGIVKKPLLINNQTFYLGMSVGVALYPNDGNDANMLLKNADAAMYKAKDDGRNTYCFYDEKMTEKAFERVFLESALTEAILKDEFIVYYQPQVDAVSNKAIGVEALVRWSHPALGIISPAKFIPLAEETGLIVALDRLVMKQALKEFSKWHKEGLINGKLSMNLAMKQISEPDFMEFLESLIKNSDCIAKHIEFEVTESQIMNNPQKSIEMLKKIEAMGIKLSIDDFGTGYSSLSYLKKLPINKLKIDQSFIKDLPDDSEDVAISKTIINLCENLNLEVIAEGVETKEQLNFLLKNGCNNIQGYYFSRPLPSKQMREYLLR
ncbi:MAG: EAL domain-containing protein [Campylobacterota bacterium]|nr:EAL domain-containing protein [Campylobacterota bacterium]